MWQAFLGMVVASTAEQSLKSYSEPTNNPGDMPHRRDDGVLNNLSGFLHTVHGAADHVIGADHLQPRAVNNVADRGIHALYLGAQRSRRDFQAFRDGTQLLP